MVDIYMFPKQFSVLLLICFYTVGTRGCYPEGRLKRSVRELTVHLHIEPKVKKGWSYISARRQDSQWAAMSIVFPFHHQINVAHLLAIPLDKA
jgi:hypothetical protein